MLAIEITQSIESLIESRSGELPVDFKMQQEIEHLITFKRWGMLIGIMDRELLDPAKIRLDGSLLQIFKMDKAGEVLIPILAGDYVV